MYASTLGGVIYFVFAHLIKIARFLNVYLFEDVPEFRLSLSKMERETALRKLCRLSSQGEDPVSAPDFYVVRLDCGALFFIRTKRRDIMSERHF